MNTPLGSMASRMGFESGFLVLESGQGADSDEALRVEITQVTGNQFISGQEYGLRATSPVRMRGIISAPVMEAPRPANTIARW